MGRTPLIWGTADTGDCLYCRDTVLGTVMANQQQTGKPDEGADAPFESNLSPNPAAPSQGNETHEMDRFDQTAYDIAELQDRLVTLSGVELRQVPVLKAGAQLRAGATYINLNDAKRTEFTGTENMTVEPGAYIVPKDKVSYDLWNRLTNVG